MWSGSGEGSYFRLKIVVSLNSRLESNKEEEGPGALDRLERARRRERGCRYFFFFITLKPRVE